MLHCRDGHVCASTVDLHRDPLEANWKNLSNADHDSYFGNSFWWANGLAERCSLYQDKADYHISNLWRAFGDWFATWTILFASGDARSFADARCGLDDTNATSNVIFLWLGRVE